MEAEVFLLGKWKNFDELEDELSLPEIDFILGAKRKEEHTWWKYYAGFKGVDLDKGKEDSVESRLKEVERRAAERLYGAEAVERQEFADLGFDFNVG